MRLIEHPGADYDPTTCVEADRNYELAEGSEHPPPEAAWCGERIKDSLSIGGERCAPPGRHRPEKHSRRLAGRPPPDLPSRHAQVG